MRTFAPTHKSKEAGNRIPSELRTLQRNGEANFVQKGLSLLKKVHEMCEKIKIRKKKRNLILITARIMSMKGRNDTILYAVDHLWSWDNLNARETSEGLDKKMTTNYYARMRFTQQLLSFLHVASSELSRIVFVLALDEKKTPFDLKNLNLEKKLRSRKCCKPLHHHDRLYVRGIR